MANKKITLKRKTAAGFDVLYPEVKKADLLTSSGTALNTFADSIVDGASVTLVSGEGYLVGRYNTGDPSIHQHAEALSAAQVRSIFGISQDGHSETIANIDGDATDLQTVLDSKVPLDANSKIPREYFPVVNTDSLTFGGTLAGGTTSGNAVTLSNFFNLQSQWYTSIYDDNDNVVDNQKGTFRIVSTPGYFTNHTGVTADSKTFNFTFRILNTSTPNFTEVDDYQATNSDLALLLESGDRIVLTEIEKASSTVFNLYFDVINVNYGLAGTGNQQRGIVQLSSATVKGSMSSSASSSKIVDEKVMRDVMKDVVEIESFNSNHSSGQYHNATEIYFGTFDASSISPGAVGDWRLNITNGKVFECTAADEANGNYTWAQRAVIYNDGTTTAINLSNIKPARYYDFNGTTFVGKELTSNATSGTLYALDPLEDDLVFEV